MNQRDLDELDLALDALSRSGPLQHPLDAGLPAGGLRDGELASGGPGNGDPGNSARDCAGLLSLLAQVPEVDWPDRATGDRVQARVAAALGRDSLTRPAVSGSPRIPVPAPIPVPDRIPVPDGDSAPGQTGPPDMIVVRSAPSPRTGAASRRTGRGWLARRPAALLAAAAVLLVAVGVGAVMSMRSGSSTAPTAAPAFRSQFTSTVLAAGRPGQSRSSGVADKWEFASYLTTPGWRPDRTLHSPVGSLSCPTTASCYVTSTRPTSRTSGVNFNMLEVSRDGGNSWTALGLPADISITTPLQCPVTATTCLAAGTDAGHVALLRTADGGRSWSARRIGPVTRADQLACTSGLSCTGIFSSAGWTPGYRYRAPAIDVLVTRDGGRSWSVGPPTPRGQLPDYLTCHGATCVLFDQLITLDNARSVNGNGALTIAPGRWTAWFSHDGGAHWRRGTHPGHVWTVGSGDQPAQPGIVSCATDRRCWAFMTTDFSSGVRTVILATTDGGAHWSAQAGSAPLGQRFAPGAISCPGAGQCWAGGISARYEGPLMLATRDGGDRWFPVSLRGIAGDTGATGVVPDLGQVSCPAPGHCVAMPFTNSNARRVPVYRLGGQP
jgi:photosystem II stability/assembly factor-like uncharacterized protein